MIFLKESYLFLRNLYGLVLHPFKTIVRIRKKPDWSQTILVLGLPVWSGLAALLTLLFFLIGVLFWTPTNEVLVTAIFAGLFLVSATAAIALGYIGYWTGKYLIYKRLLQKP